MSMKAVLVLVLGLSGIVLISVAVAVLASKYINRKKEKTDSGRSVCQPPGRWWRRTGSTRIP